MGIFSRKRPLTERFPVNRLQAIPIVLGGAITACASHAGMEVSVVWKTRFFLGYIVGYTDYLDQIDERFGGTVRKATIDSLYGSELGRAYFRQISGYLLLDDQQAKRGWGAGVPDGNRYFSALENNSDAVGATQSLEAMFDIGSVDVRGLME